LDIYNLSEHIVFNENESVLGLRIEQEHNFFYQAIETLRMNKKYAHSRTVKAEFEKMYLEMSEKLKDNPDYLIHIASENINLQEELKTIKKAQYKPLNVRTENNYLRLIFSLANGVEGFNPKKPYEAAQLILDETEIDLSKETLAVYISRAYELESKNRI
jgi:hypothetical protein